MSTNLAFDELPRGNGGIGATEQISRLLNEAGVDVPTSLYDEALALARDGRLAPAAERLRMLLVLDPGDGEAALLLGKILASRNKWQEALSMLDNAAAKGAVLPPGLRDNVSASLRREVQDAEEQRNNIVSREQGEIRGLRSEAKRLRSDNAALEAQVDDLSRRVKLWSSITALVAGSASALLLAAMLFGGTNDGVLETEEVVAEDVIEAPVGPEPTTLAAAAAPEVESVAPPVASATVANPVPRPSAMKASTPAAATRSPAAAAAGGYQVHVVKKGETLGKLAQRYYGKSSAWPTIQEANKDLLGNDIALSLGMKIRIPKVEN